MFSSASTSLLSHFLSSFCCYGSSPHPFLHSFPTRRSSDLLLWTRDRGEHRDVRRGGPAVLSPAGARDRSGSITCAGGDRKSTRLNSSHLGISYAVFCLKKKKKNKNNL